MTRNPATYNMYGQKVPLDWQISMLEGFQRGTFDRSKPEINVVYDTPRQNHSVIYLETNNEGES